MESPSPVEVQQLHGALVGLEQLLDMQLTLLQAIRRQLPPAPGTKAFRANPRKRRDAPQV